MCAVYIEFGEEVFFFDQQNPNWVLNASKEKSNL